MPQPPKGAACWAVVGPTRLMWVGTLWVLCRDGSYRQARVTSLSKPFVSGVGQHEGMRVRIGYIDHPRAEPTPEAKLRWQGLVRSLTPPEQVDFSCKSADFEVE